MKDFAKFKSYKIGPDTKNPGDHRATVTLELQIPPTALKEFGDDCSDFIGLDVEFTITKIQRTIHDTNKDLAALR